jgi:hypothetical protein
MPHLVQVFLPLHDHQGRRCPSDLYNDVRSTLTDMFGGLTAYTRAPAEGVWQSGAGLKRDDIVVVEVMVDRLDHRWWGAYRGELERLFQQDQIIVRAQLYEAL